MQGEHDAVASALGRGDIDGAALDDAHRELLRFVELLTRHAYRATAEDAQRLRSVGWTDDQIAEAVYITALFAMFNRIADAFGLQDPAYREMASRGQATPKPMEQAGE